MSDGELEFHATGKLPKLGRATRTDSPIDGTPLLEAMIFALATDWRGPHARSLFGAVSGFQGQSQIACWAMRERTSATPLGRLGWRMIFVIVHRSSIRRSR